VALLLTACDRAGTRPPFTCVVRRTGPAAYLQPAGELDLATAPDLDATIDRLRADGVGDIVLDLRAVTFLDCFALRVVLERAADLRAVIPGPDTVHRLFALTHTTPELRFAEAPYPVEEAEQGNLRFG
jgi:anti-anti-sigma factor